MKKGKKKNSNPEDDESDQYDDDIDTFHKQKEKILLNNEDGFDRESSEEEEVLNVAEDSDSDDEEIAAYKQQLRQINRNKFKRKLDSDLEDEAEEHNDLPDSKAWGSKRSWFQGGDVRDNKIVLSGSEDEEGAAVLEEKESLAIQQRLAARLDEDDFGIGQLVQSGKEHSEKVKKLNKVKVDLSKMSRKQELELLKKASPEFIPLVNDFREKMVELKEKLLPLMELVKTGKIVDKEADYVRSKFHILMGYLTNGCFYMYLMAKRTPVHDHPVMKRLAQFRQLAKMLGPLDMQVADDVEQLLGKLKRGEQVDLSQRLPTRPPQKKRKAFVSEVVISEKNLAVEHSDAEIDTDDHDAEDQEEEDAKRAITYQIEKNKGLTIYKKKELRNPRVKHRMKYRKAKIRRKGQVREQRAQGYYDGEHTGIRAGIIRSVKMK